MNELIAECSNPACGHLFSSTSIRGGSGAVTINSARIGVKCEICGSLAYLSPGVYDIKGAAIQLLSGPRESFETLQRIKQLLEKAIEAGTPKEEVLQQIARESVHVASVAQSVKGENYHKWVDTMTKILTVCLTFYPLWKSNESADTQQRLAQLELAVSKLENQQLRQQLASSATSGEPELSEQRKEQPSAAVVIQGNNMNISGLNIQGQGQPAKDPDAPAWVKNPTTPAEDARLLEELGSVLQHYNIQHTVVVLATLPGTNALLTIPHVTKVLNAGGYQVMLLTFNPEKMPFPASRRGINFLHLPHNNPPVICLIIGDRE